MKRRCHKQREGDKGWGERKKIRVLRKAGHCCWEP